MRVTLPHTLGRDEVRRRMHEHGHEIADQFPAGMASVETTWPNEDQMDLTVLAMGQRIEGQIEIHDDAVIIDVDLPPMLSFLSGIIESAVSQKGGKLLE